MNPPAGPDDHVRELEHGGCRLSYRLEGAGPPVVWVQGTGLHGEGWRPQVDELAREFRCLTFDNRGMGRSQPPSAALSVAQMAEDALRLAEAAKLGPAHWVGHSLGGLVALQVALQARARCRSLALLCTFSRGRDATQLTWDMFWLGLRTYLGTRAMRRRAFTEMVVPGRLSAAERDRWAAQLEPVFGHDLADHPPVVMQQLSAMRACDLTARLPELRGLPTLVVGARHDLIARRENVRRLVAQLPGSRLVEFEDAGHGVTIQRAGEINALLREHFLGVEG